MCQFWGRPDVSFDPWCCIACCCLVAPSCLTLCDCMDCSQAPLSVECSKQAYWSGLPFLPSGDLPDSGTESKSVSCSAVSYSLGLHGLQPARLLCPWDSPGNNTGVGCHSLLQGIFSTQGSNLGLLHCRQILYCLSHQRSPGVKNVSQAWQVDSLPLVPPEKL